MTYSSHLQAGHYVDSGMNEKVKRDIGTFFSIIILKSNEK